VGTTGIKNNFGSDTLNNLKRTYSLLNKNKMMIGFGISKPEDVKTFSPYCDGVIVGSKIMKSLLDKEKLDDTLNIISSLSVSCNL
jgi:tryptophan synthase alpha chain